MAFFLVFPTNGEGQLDSTRKRIKQDASLDQAQKKKITGITDLKIRVKTIKFSEENTVVNLCDLGSGNGFLDTAPKVQATK